MGKAFLWSLEKEPKSIEIVDRAGVKRTPDPKILQKRQTIRGSYVEGKYGKGVGPLIYGTRLGSRKELESQGNKHTTNEEILKAIGYLKKEVEVS